MIVASLILCFLGPLNKLKIKTFSRTRFAFALIKHSLSSFGFSSLLLSHLLLIIYCINEEIDAYKRRNAFYYGLNVTLILKVYLLSAIGPWSLKGALLVLKVLKLSAISPSINFVSLFVYMFNGRMMWQL